MSPLIKSSGGSRPPLAVGNGKSAEIAHGPAVAETVVQPLECVLVLLREVNAQVVQDGRRQVGRADGPIPARREKGQYEPALTTR